MVAVDGMGETKDEAEDIEDAIQEGAREDDHGVTVQETEIVNGRPKRTEKGEANLEAIPVPGALPNDRRARRAQKEKLRIRRGKKKQRKR